MTLRVLIIFLLLINVAYAGSTPDELVSACTADAKAICSWTQLIEAYAGKYTGIKTCFQRHHAKLSAPCKSMLTKYGYK
jgi:hypothetical protein